MDEVKQLRAENKQLKREVQELRAQLTVAEAQIKHLVELLGQNSHNSSWPSSRDKGRQKPKPIAYKFRFFALCQDPIFSNFAVRMAFELS